MGTGRNAELLFNGFRISIWDDEKILGDSDNGTILWMYLFDTEPYTSNGKYHYVHFITKPPLLKIQ